ncbi:hypothetical protein RUND412_007285 [Rhizina undulata]
MAYVVGLMFKGDHRAMIPALEAQMAYVAVCCLRLPACPVLVPLGYQITYVVGLVYWWDWRFCDEHLCRSRPFKAGRPAMAYVVGLMFKGGCRAIVPALGAQMTYVIGLLLKASCLPSAGPTRISDNLRRWSGLLVGLEVV